jgi:hypothetical protein
MNKTYLYCIFTLIFVLVFQSAYGAESFSLSVPASPVRACGCSAGSTTIGIYNTNPVQKA